MNKGSFLALAVFSILIAICATGCSSRETASPEVEVAASQTLPLAETALTPTNTTTTTRTAPHTPSPEPTPAPTTPLPQIDHFAYYPSGKPALVWSFSLHMQNLTTGWSIYRESQEARVDRILRTSDGGTSWYDITPIDPPGGVSQAFFLDDQHAWVIQPGEQQALVWRTTDGGQTWTPGQPLEIVDLSNTSITFIDSQDGWLFYGQAIGMHKVPAVVYRTSDGGLNWEIIYADIPGQQGELFSGYKSDYVFQDEYTGMAGVASPYVLPEVVATHDGGFTWQTIFLPAPGPYTDQEIGDCDMTSAPTFFSPSTVLIVSKCWVGEGTHRYLYQSVDGGQEWSTSRIPGSDGVVTFTDAQNGLAVSINGSDPNVSQIYQTSDGGLTWVSLGEVDWWTSQLDFVSKLEGWTIARRGESTLFLHTSDGGRIWQQLPAMIIHPAD